MPSRKKGEKKRVKSDMEPMDKQNKEHVFHSRKYPRVPLEMEVEYQNGDDFVSGRSRDIGQGGMYIKSESPLNDGINTKIRFVLDKGKETVEVGARVAWTSKGEDRKRDILPRGMGVEFVENDQEKRKLIGEFVRDLSDLMRIMAITNKRRDS